MHGGSVPTEPRVMVKPIPEPDEIEGCRVRMSRSRALSAAVLPLVLLAGACGSAAVQGRLQPEQQLAGQQRAGRRVRRPRAPRACRR